jgi:predicted MFS family arabinose efflux permease
MLLATAAFFACAYPLSVAWFFVWRFLSGISGGSLMVLVATTILPHIPIGKRSLVSGMIFLGLGLGIAASGTLIPGLLQLGLQQTSIGLGILSLLLTALSWFGWPSSEPPEAAVTVSGEETIGTTISLWILYGQYAANALGLVPAMILLVDYIARGLGLGAQAGAAYWILFGLAGIIGPLAIGYFSARIGHRRTYRVALFLQIVALGLLSFTKNLVAIGVSTDSRSSKH